MKSKIYAIIGLLAMTITNISCQKESELLEIKVENTVHDHSHAGLKYVTTNDIPEVMSFLEYKTGEELQFSIKKDFTETRNQDDIVILNIQTDSILQTTDENEVSNYSFVAEADSTNQEITITNYVVKENAEGFYSFIIQYKPEASWYNSLQGDFTLEGYTGDISFYNSDGLFISKSSFTNGIVIQTENRDNCDPGSGSGSTGGTGGSGGSGGGTGSGTGGSTGGTTGGSGGSGTTGGTGGGSGGGGGPNITIICGCAPGHVGGNQSNNCNCQLNDIIVLILSPNTQNMLRNVDPCDPITDPCERSSGGDPCENDVIGPIAIFDDCTIASNIGIDCSVLLDFEQNYRQRMSAEEIAIFDNMSRVKQLSYLANAQFATWKAEELYPNSLYNGKGDAFRHAYWNGLNVIDLGLALAELLATAHEEKPFTYPYNYKEKQMDLHNNQIGRNRYNFVFNGYSSLEQSIQFAIITGELKYLNNLARDGRATASSELIPTNQ